MDLYKFHEKPEHLHGYDRADDIVYERVSYLAKQGVKLNKTQLNTLASTPHGAFDYSYFVLQKRWPEGEPAILKSAGYSFMYARNILKRRWLEAEKTIAKEPYWKTEYEKNFQIKI